jgi:hypothetical protein
MASRKTKAQGSSGGGVSNAIGALGGGSGGGGSGGGGGGGGGGGDVGGGDSGSRKTFLEKLLEILQTADPAIICWDDDGKVILINDKDRLSREILGKYFRSSQYDSFVRQLSFYNFRRTGIDRSAKADGPIGAGAAPAAASQPGSSSAHMQPIMEFMNDRFTRDNPDVSLTIKRKTYGVDDVKEEMLALKSDVTQVKDEVQAVKESVRQLGAQFEEMRRAMLQVLHNQQHLHTQQQKHAQEQRQLQLQQQPASPKEDPLADDATGAAASSAAAGATPPAALAAASKPGGAAAGTIAPKPFGSVATSLSTDSLASMSLPGASGGGGGSTGTLQSPIGSFSMGMGGGGSHVWGGGSFVVVDDNSDAAGGAGGQLDSEALGQLFSLYLGDATLGEGQGVELLVPVVAGDEDGSDASAFAAASAASATAGGGGRGGQAGVGRPEYRVPAPQQNKRLRGRGPSQIQDPTMGPPLASGSGTLARRIPVGDGGGGGGGGAAGTAAAATAATAPRLSPGVGPEPLDPAADGSFRFDDELAYDDDTGGLNSGLF